MNDRPIEERLRDALDGLEPSPESARSAREAAVRAVAGVPQAPAALATRRVRGRRAMLWTALAGAVLTGVAAAAAVMVGGGGHTTIPAGPEAEAAIAESSVLARAPWLVQSEGAPYIQDVRPLPSLRFPAGTGYPEALNRLARSVAARGGLPPGTRTGPPLPRGAVWAPSPKGPRLDLTAPFSYAVPEGVILTPSFAIHASATPAEAVRIARALQEGHYVGEAAARRVRVDIPHLRPCQRLPRPARCDLAPVPEPAGS